MSLDKDNELDHTKVLNYYMERMKTKKDFTRDDLI